MKETNKEESIIQRSSISTNSTTSSSSSSKSDKIQQQQQQKQQQRSTISTSNTKTKTNINSTSTNNNNNIAQEENNDNELYEWEKSITENGTYLIDKLETFCFPSSSTSPKTSQQQGLSLPIHAISWLYHCCIKIHKPSSILDEDRNVRLVVDPLLRERFIHLLAEGLNTIQHLRISNDAWPPKPAARNNKNNGMVSGSNTTTASVSVSSEDSGISSSSNNTNQAQNLSNKDSKSLENNNLYRKLTYHPNINLHALFPALKVLLCDGMPPEYLSGGMYALRNKIEVIRLERGCIYNLLDFFHPATTAVTTLRQPSSHYASLTHLKLAYCAIDDGTINYSTKKRTSKLFQIFPNLKCISLTNNSIQHVQKSLLPHLTSLIHLQSLDLSYNKILNMDKSFYYLGNITTLKLSHNVLNSTEGLDRLYSLVSLDISHNLIQDVTSKFMKLPDLKDLSIHHNPLQLPDHYHQSTTSQQDKMEENDNKDYYRLYLFNQFRESRCSTSSTNDFTDKTATSDSYTTWKEILPNIDTVSLTKYEYDHLQTITFVSYPNHFVQYSTSIIEGNNGTTSNGISTNSTSSVQIISKVLPLKIVPNPYNSRTVTISNCLDSSSSPVHGKKKKSRGANPSINDDNERSVNINFTLHDIVSHIKPISTIKASHTQEEDINDKDRDIIASNTNTYFPKEVDTSSSAPKEDVIQTILSSIQTTSTSSNTTTKESNISKQVVHNESLAIVSKDIDNALVASKTNNNQHASSSSSSLVTNLNSKKLVEISNNTSDTTVEKEITKSFQKDHIITAAATDINTNVSKNTNNNHIIKNTSNTSKEGKEPKKQQEHNSYPIPQKLQTTATTPETQEQQLNTKSLFLQHQKIPKNQHPNHPYDGDSIYKQVNILNYLDLYFRHYVFQQGSPSSSLEQTTSTNNKVISLFPRIIVAPYDYKDVVCNLPTYILHEKSNTETFVDVWFDEYYTLPCNMHASNRIHCCTKPKLGFHGEALPDGSKIQEPLQMILCLSNVAFYFISHSSFSTLNIFQDAVWPNALSRHSFKYLKRITIGFSFQRLVLHFISPTDFNKQYIYMIMTCNKLRTISLLQKLRLGVIQNQQTQQTQDQEEDLLIDNDDRIILDALTKLCNTQHPSLQNITEVGSVLHYQLVRQKWASSSSDRGLVPRTIIITDTAIFLLDEIYSQSSMNDDYDVHFTLVDVGNIITNKDVVEVKSGVDGDPRIVTIVLKPFSFYSRYRNWRLVCRDRDGADKLVDDVRKVISF